MTEGKETLGSFFLRTFALDRTIIVTCEYNALVIHKLIHLHARGGLVLNSGMIKLIMRIRIRVRWTAIVGRYIAVYTDLHKTESSPTGSKNHQHWYKDLLIYAYKIPVLVSVKIFNSGIVRVLSGRLFLRK